MFGVDDALALGVTAAASVGGGMMSNAANAKQASQANQLSVLEQGATMAQSDAQFKSAQDYNSQEARVAREYASNFSADQAQINRDWQTNMSNTAYQRAVKDMKAAGINPIMAAGGGMSASTPSGSSPMGPTNQASSPGPSPGSPAGSKAAVMQDVVSPAVSNALQAQRLSSDLQTAAKQRDQTEAATDNVKSQTQYNYQNVTNAKEIGRRLSNEADASEYAVPLAQQQVRNTAEQASKAREDRIGQAQTNVRTGMVGPGDPWNLQTYVPALSGVLSSWANPGVSSPSSSPPNPTPSDLSPVPFQVMNTGADRYLLRKAGEISTSGVR